MVSICETVIQPLESFKDKPLLDNILQLCVCIRLKQFSYHQQVSLALLVPLRVSFIVPSLALNNLGKRLISRLLGMTSKTSRE
ncbi:hypothetical protein AYJ57_20575 (plasmid) [Salipiger sp. CCB-MM3]|nr:hypothetical protein AYJ57_20575 [Salipiger sp. CCB-MM3]